MTREDKKKERDKKRQEARERAAKDLKDLREDIQARFGRGFLYRAKNFLYALILSATIEGIAISLLQHYPALANLDLVNAQEIVSLFIAEIPIGIILWVAFQRRESESRKVLDAIEIDKAIAQFEHLVVHASDPWTYAAYPDKRFFVVNNKTHEAYFVSDRIYRLMRAGIVERTKRYSTYEALLEYFKANKIEIVKQVGEGSDLSLGLGVRLGPVFEPKGD